MFDKYTLKAFLKITAPLWSVGLLALAAYYFPWLLFVVAAAAVTFFFVCIAIITKDEAAKMRSEVYRRSS